MLNINIVKLISDIKKAARTYVVHSTICVSQRSIKSCSLQEKRIKEQLEKQVFMTVTKQNKEYKFRVDIPIDTKAGFLSNSSWGMLISGYHISEEIDDELVLLMLYMPMEDAVLYWIKDSGLYISRGDRAEAVTFTTEPGSQMSVDERILQDVTLFKKVMQCGCATKQLRVLASGSVLKDIVDFLTGKTCVLAVHGATFEEIGDIWLSLFNKQAITMSKYDGTYLFINNKARDIVLEEEE